MKKFCDRTDIHEAHEGCDGRKRCKRSVKQNNIKEASIISLSQRLKETEKKEIGEIYGLYQQGVITKEQFIRALQS